MHFSTGPGVPRPPHRELSIDCKIFFCYKIGRTGRHRPKGEASSLREALGKRFFFSFFYGGGRPNPDLNESNTCARDRRRRPKAATAAPEASHFALMPSVSRRSSRGGLVMATLALADD